jgi:hypothetical protein
MLEMLPRTISDTDDVSELSQLILKPLGNLCLSGLERVLQLLLFKVLLGL